MLRISAETTRAPLAAAAAREGMEAPAEVLIVDDDPSMREALSSLVEFSGWAARSFASAEAFLASAPPSGPHCLVLDIGLPDLDGLDLQARVAGERTAMPIVFLTGQADIPKTVRAMKAGATAFLEKPVAEDDLVAAIAAALARSREALDVGAALAALQARYASLSPRERQVMDLVVGGELNKRIAAALGISEITVKAHRGRMMEKMRARSVADLVRMSTRLGPADRHLA